jgi:hypothetical protein
MFGGIQLQVHHIFGPLLPIAFPLRGQIENTQQTGQYDHPTELIFFHEPIRY